MSVVFFVFKTRSHEEAHWGVVANLAVIKAIHAAEGRSTTVSVYTMPVTPTCTFPRRLDPPAPRRKYIEGDASRPPATHTELDEDAIDDDDPHTDSGDEGELTDSGEEELTIVSGAAGVGGVAGAAVIGGSSQAPIILGPSCHAGATMQWRLDGVAPSGIRAGIPTGRTSQ